MSLFHIKDLFLKNSIVSANLIWHFKEIREADGWFLMTNFLYQPKICCLLQTAQKNNSPFNGAGLCYWKRKGRVYADKEVRLDSEGSGRITEH